MVVCYGVLPGFLPDPTDIYIAGGIAACAARDFPSNLFSCPNVGFPSNYQSSFGQPVNWLSGFFQWLGLDVVNSTRLVWVIAIALALWGARRFFARITDVRWLAWVGVLSFALAPIVSSQGGYGALQLGFLLVPTYLLMDLRLAEGVAPRRAEAISRAAFSKWAPS